MTVEVLNDQTRVADTMLLIGLPLLALGVVSAGLVVPFLKRMRAVAG